MSENHIATKMGDKIIWWRIGPAVHPPRDLLCLRVLDNGWSEATAWFTPGEARELAKQLESLADDIDHERAKE